MNIRQIDRKADNRRIFMETSSLIASSPYLWESVRLSLSRSHIVMEDEAVEAGPDISLGAEICLSREKTVNAALKNRGERIAIHNFASALNPGGGVRSGSSAQEESICRTTTLYSVLDNYLLSRYYSVHHDLRGPDADLYTSALIYSPDIVIIRSDSEGCPILDESEYMKCDVVTIAAPRLGEDGILYTMHNRKKLSMIFEERFDRFFASASKAGSTVAVTGAFGCGAFHNDPYLVAEALRASIGKYERKFKRIELAVFCNDGEDKNYKAFESVFRK